ncbi:MAG: hypothetical protein EOO30_10560 [Comamonadaceae bacterium]|nr:MAG: hypothetical protein EOO30_10560 [Comamonadaceae bacterium]
MSPAASLASTLARRLGAELVETHISWILLTPALAYKLKKPVHLPFVDYSTLERRRHFCEEEVRLNQRLAPALYLGVSRVTGTPDAPSIDGPGETLDWAVRMRRFPPGALFSERVAAGTLTAASVARFAARLAHFHAGAPRLQSPAPGGQLLQRALAALAGCEALLAPEERERLQQWIASEGEPLEPFWAARRAAGFVRECHGDLHLANILELDGDVVAFDCIEFDAGLRFIDVVEEVAFPLMDFAAQGQPALGWRFLDGWLEATGDYEGVAGLRLALVYRALVRATVENLRSPGSAAARTYARHALAWSRPGEPALCITHGLPGSGKTFRSQAWLEARGAIRIRSDVERKRMHGLQAQADSRAAGLAIYTHDATRRTYERLFVLARIALRAGFPVVLDAAFLRRDERAAARALAVQLGVPFKILDCDAPPEVLRARLAQRRGDASEADAEVLAALAAAAEPLDADERAAACPP